jgi:hypothetical protein
MDCPFNVTPPPSAFVQARRRRHAPRHRTNLHAQFGEISWRLDTTGHDHSTHSASAIRRRLPPFRTRHGFRILRRGQLLVGTGSTGLRAWHAVRVLSGPPRIHTRTGFSGDSSVSPQLAFRPRGICRNIHEGHYAVPMRPYKFSIAPLGSQRPGGGQGGGGVSGSSLGYEGGGGRMISVTTSSSYAHIEHIS